MIRKFIICLVCLFIFNSLIAKNKFNNAFESDEQPFDVLKYELDLNIIDIEKKFISGSNKITIKWKDNSKDNKFYFMLENLYIDSIYYDGIVVGYNESNLNDKLNKHYYINRFNFKDTSEIIITYNGYMKSEDGNQSWGGVHYIDSILFSIGVSMNDYQISSAKYWMPCYDHPGDKALFEGRFTISDKKFDFNKFYTISNGLHKETINKNNTRTDIFIQNVPSATYLLNFALGNFYSNLTYSNGSIPIVFYSSQNDSALSKLFYQNVEVMKKFFESYFTPYPFEKIGYVNAAIGAMEHQTLITMPRNLIINSAKGGNYYNKTAAHELAHSWFGNLVTPKDFRDVWFNEAFATFCEALWSEYLQENKLTQYTQSFSNKIFEDWNNYLNYATSIDGIIPLYNFKNYNSETGNFNVNISNYPFTIYFKGSVIVQLLMYELGREKFFEAIRYILNKYSYGNISTNEFKEELENFTGINLDNFFEQWIYQSGYPILDIKYQINGNNINLYVKQIQDEKIYGNYTDIILPVNYIISDKNNIKYYRINQKEQLITDEIDNLDKLDLIQINNKNGIISPIKYQISQLSSVDKTKEKYTLFDTYDYIKIYFDYDINSVSINLFNINGDLINNGYTINDNYIEIYKTSLPSGKYFLKVDNQIINFVIVK